jgi:hypothetical protein
MPRPELTQEQASLLTSQEYEHLQATYRVLFKSLSMTEANSLQLTTLEGTKYIIQVTSEGWKVIEGGQVSERKRTWEMVEDLLRSVSPLFKQGWDVMLLEKLHILACHQDTNDEEETDIPQGGTEIHKD